MKVNIYSLVHSGKTLYVGATSMDLHIRLQGHRTANKFNVPKNELEIKLLEKCGIDDATECENKWIDKFGLPQIKSTYTKAAKSRGNGNKNKIVIRFREEDQWIIEALEDKRKREHRTSLSGALYAHLATTLKT